MTTLRTRLSQAAWDSAAANGTPDDILDAVLAILGSPTDADVERVALGIMNARVWTNAAKARAAIRALVGEVGG